MLLTVLVFVLTFGLGTLLGLYGARRLAQQQLLSRLFNSATALAGSSAPLNEEVLSRFAPLLDAEIIVLDTNGQIIAHSAGNLPWEEIRQKLTYHPRIKGIITINHQRYYYATATGRIPATAKPVSIVLLAGQSYLDKPIRTILNGYLIIIAATSLLLAAGMYILGMSLVSRIKRLNRIVDQTLSEEQVSYTRSGDELSRLKEAFEDLMKRLEQSRQRLIHQQRLAVTGKIAASIAHELRNPLQAMRLMVQMIRENCPTDQQENCDLIIGEIDRLNLLTNELLVLADADNLRIEKLNLADEITETLKLLKLQFRQRDTKVEMNLPKLPPVKMDRNRCRQLLLNLLLNAVEASPRGGTIRIAGQTLTDKVIVRIADNGNGFPPEVISGQADEFFSTKTSGAGLGLSICRRIINQANGQLNLYNTDHGAVAEIVLPANSEA